MSFKQLLIHRCTIQEKTTAQNDVGQMIETWSEKEANVKCRANLDRTPSVSETIGKQTTQGGRFYFDIATEIEVYDRIVFDGNTYDVVLAPQDSSGHHLEVLVSRVFTE